MLFPRQAKISLFCVTTSVSGESEHRPDVIAMTGWAQTELEKYGVTTAAIPLGQQVVNGQTLDLPPVIVGRIGEAADKKTILIYGHLDVQPVRKICLRCVSCDTNTVCIIDLTGIQERWLVHG